MKNPARSVGTGIAAALGLAIGLSACEAPVDNNADTANIGATSNIDDAVDNGAMAATTAAPTTPDYVANAALGDMYEIASSKIAKTKASSASLKSFADTMISDHSATTARLKETLPKAGLTVTPPATLDARRQALVDQLQTATPDGFDALYRQQQLAAHQEALQLHQSYAKDGDNPALAQVAAETAPKVQAHLDMLKQMKQ